MVVYKDYATMGYTGLCQYHQERRDCSHIASNKRTTLPMRFSEDVRVVPCAVRATFPYMQAYDIDRRMMLADLRGILFGEMLVQKKTHRRRHL